MLWKDNSCYTHLYNYGPVRVSAKKTFCHTFIYFIFFSISLPYSVCTVDWLWELVSGKTCTELVAYIVSNV